MTTWKCGIEKYDTHEWRMKKRRELQNVRKALKILYDGCAFTPGYHEIVRMDQELERATELNSVKNWGR